MSGSRSPTSATDSSHWKAGISADSLIHLQQVLYEKEVNMNKVFYVSTIFNILFKFCKYTNILRLSETQNLIRGHKLIQYSLANLKLGWPLIKLYTFQSSETLFNYMLRKSNIALGDPMDGIILPEKWHNLCVAMDGASKSMRAVSVSKQLFLLRWDTPPSCIINCP